MITMTVTMITIAVMKLKMITNSQSQIFPSVLTHCRLTAKKQIWCHLFPKVFFWNSGRRLTNSRKSATKRHVGDNDLNRYRRQEEAGAHTSLFSLTARIVLEQLQLQISVPFLKWQTLSLRGEVRLTSATKLLEKSRSTRQTSSPSEMHKQVERFTNTLQTTITCLYVLIAESLAITNMTKITNLTAKQKTRQLCKRKSV